jgi:hypothetical protein
MGLLAPNPSIEKIRRERFEKKIYKKRYNVK